MLSTSSPFWNGKETGLHSYRTSVFRAVPRTGMPDEFDSWAEYQQDGTMAIGIEETFLGPVGSVSRITIPQDMRDDLGIEEGDILTVRVEENPTGTRQMVLWRSEHQPEAEEA